MSVLFGHPLPSPQPYTGQATEAQIAALMNICEGFGQVKADIAVRVLVTEFKGSFQELTKAEASQLIEWAKTVPEQGWKAVAHRAAELMGQGTLL